MPSGAEHVEAESADGTLVPLTIVRRRDMTLDGSAPAWLGVDGACGDTTHPSVLPERLVWVERGGIIGFAGLHGGGEEAPYARMTGTSYRAMRSSRVTIVSRSSRA